MSKHGLLRRTLITTLILTLLWSVCLTGAASGPGGFEYGDINADRTN